MAFKYGSLVTLFMKPLLIFALLLLFPPLCLAAAEQDGLNGGETTKEPSPAQPPVVLYLNGQAHPLQNPLIIRDGLTYGPFREIFTILGAKPDYISRFNRLLVWVEWDESSFLLERGSKVFYHNNIIASLPAPTFIENGTTYFPIRFLLELCSYRIHWDPPGSGDAPIRIHLFNSPEKEQKPLPVLPGNPFGQKASSVPVLLYHHLLPAAEHDGTNGSIVSVEDFQKQMDYLFKNGYYPVTLADLYLFNKGEKKLPARSVVITFDDGYLSNYDYAFPILREYRFRAVQFPITSLIEKSYPWLPHMDWDLMAEAATVFEYHSHTHDLHYYVDDEAALLVTPKEQIRADLLLSRELLDCFAFAYPFGVSSREAVQILKETGYKMAFIIQRGNVAPGDDPFLLKRHMVFPTTSLNEFSAMLKTAR